VGVKRGLYNAGFVDPANGRWRVVAREILVFGAFAAMTVAMTWPWAAHMRDTSSDPGDS
jgi:hypothetical protein